MYEVQSQKMDSKVLDFFYLDLPLLKEDTITPVGVIKVSASSEKGEDNRACNGVLGAPIGGVWKPATSTDTEYLQFEFPRNHIISSMEIRGESGNFIDHPYYQQGVKKGGMCPPLLFAPWDTVAVC